MVQPISVGVLALQGAFQEHISAFRELAKARNLNVNVVEVRTKSQLEQLDGLVIPGGESTAMTLIADAPFIQSLRSYVTSAKPVWGTCAGMILLANEIENQKQHGQDRISGFPAVVSRNYFGRQISSFEQDIDVRLSDKDQKGEDNKFRAVFIRAPAITKIDPKCEKEVNVIASLQRSSQEDVVVAAQYQNLLVTAFHPELTRPLDLRFHSRFLDMILEQRKQQNCP